MHFHAEICGTLIIGSDTFAIFTASVVFQKVATKFVDVAPTPHNFLAEAEGGAPPWSQRIYSGPVVSTASRQPSDIFVKELILVLVQIQIIVFCLTYDMVINREHSL